MPTIHNGGRSLSCSDSAMLIAAPKVTPASLTTSTSLGRSSVNAQRPTEISNASPTAEESSVCTSTCIGAPY
jgi:hypothetical protein